MTFGFCLTHPGHPFKTFVDERSGRFTSLDHDSDRRHKAASIAAPKRSASIRRERPAPASTIRRVSFFWTDAAVAELS
jgi:hypothetical protein